MAPTNETEERLDELIAKTQGMESDLRDAILHIVEFVREEEKLIRQEQQIAGRRRAALARAEEELGRLLE